MLHTIFKRKKIDHLSKYAAMFTYNEHSQLDQMVDRITAMALVNDDAWRICDLDPSL